VAFGRRQLLIGSGGVAMSLFGCFRSGRSANRAGGADDALYLYRDSKTELEGFIDGDGNVRIPARFREVGQFAEERAVVYLAGGGPAVPAVIDAHGEILFQLPPSSSIEDRFAEGLLGVLVGNDGDSAYLDRAGKERFRVRTGYPTSGPASGGRVKFVDPKTDREGFVDLTGLVVIPARYARVQGFSEGLAAVEEPAEKEGYIDVQGNGVIPPRFNNARSFSCGRAQVRGGYIDKTGKLVIAIDGSRIDHYQDFSDGLAHFEDGRGDDNRAGFIDTTGAVVIRQEFRLALRFSEGLAAATRPDDSWGYIDRTGRWVIRPSFDGAASFKGGLARVQNDRKDGRIKVGYVNRRGRWVFDWEERRRPPLLI
jgi:hypothetical protein